MKRTLALLLGLSLAGCGRDETIHAYGAGERSYRLQTLDGERFAPRAILSFPAPGRVSGNGPCNSFSAAQTVPYPWIAIGPIAATKRACPDLAAEQRYFAALSEMTLGRVDGTRLRLTNDAGREMVFSEVTPGG